MTSVPSSLDALRSARIPVFRLAVLVAIFVQLVVLREVSFGHFLMLKLGFENSEITWYLHSLSKISLFAGVALILATVIERRFNAEPLLLKTMRWPVLAFHFGLLGLLIFLLSSLPQGSAHDYSDTELFWRYALTSLTFVTWQVTAVILVLPRFRFSDMRRGSIVFMATMAGAAMVLTWSTHPALDLVKGVIEGSTLSLTLFLYSLFGNAETVLSLSDGEPLVQAADFAIIVSARCAGYQGMIASSLIITGMVILEWPAIRKGRALALGLMAVLTVFLLNSLRIALLLHIGEAYSPEIAVKGFHSYFGTLSLLIIVALAMMALQHPFFRIASAPTAGLLSRLTGVSLREKTDELMSGAYLMVPLAVYLTLSMLLGLFGGDFNWLYPVLAVAGIGIMVAYWRMIADQFVDGINFSGFFVGGLVFVFWIWWIPADSMDNLEFAAELFSASPVIVAGWIVFRLLGSSIVVPVLEELAFRAGMPRVISAFLSPAVGSTKAGVVAFIVSSFAFGVLHSNIFAGAMAGAAYAALTLRTGRVGDAIVAHAITNFLIAITAIALEKWYLW